MEQSQDKPPGKPSFTIVGCGKTGSALNKNLTNAGYRPAGFASRTLSSARGMAEEAGIKNFGTKPWEITNESDIVFITTPDGSIAEVCASIAEHHGFKKGAVVLHCSGAHPSTILSTAKNCKAKTGSMHPLQSFASKTLDYDPFKGIIISVEGDMEAMAAVKTMAEDLGAVFTEIKTEGKTLYHASAVVASNYLVALLDLSFKLIKKAGIPEEDVYKVLKPLISGTLSNIERTGIPNALTGPIERGDSDTIRTHVMEIEKHLPDLLSLYKQLGQKTIDVAQAKGSLDGPQVETLKKILKNS